MKTTLTYDKFEILQLIREDAKKQFPNYDLSDATLSVSEGKGAFESDNASISMTLLDKVQPLGDDVHATLRNVYKTGQSGGTVRLTGEIYGDKKGRFKDGTSVTTSTVLRFEGDKVVTKNSTYWIESYAKGGK